MGVSSAVSRLTFSRIPLSPECSFDFSVGRVRVSQKRKRERGSYCRKLCDFLSVISRYGSMCAHFCLFYFILFSGFWRFGDQYFMGNILYILLKVI